MSAPAGSFSLPLCRCEASGASTYGSTPNRSPDASPSLLRSAALQTEPQTDEIELRYLLASLAAVKGHPGLAVSIEALDVDPGLDDDPLLKRPSIER
jgi:hypothetical protein